jgi:endo-1,4-beta-D-glucanase Y
MAGLSVTKWLAPMRGAGKASLLLIGVVAIPIYYGVSSLIGMQIPTPHISAAALAVHRDAVPPASGRRLGVIDGADWESFKTRFIQPDGKLVDSHSQLSHSEGQGYAMLLALAANDRAVFDNVWDWTRNNLKRDEDALLAWKWKPSEDGGAVDDANDAADADILVAWALHRAAKQWRDPAYDQAALPMARDILNKLVRDVGGFTVLLPGLSGFEKKDGITVNLSYWIFPAFQSL